ncbi:MAG TPA: helix-turn-helix transcriptional regulator [Burkholderiaceae bacterium]|nr:helix-turn-helix transcriptional regulator [Burkholderiaceae bacterium]
MITTTEALILGLLAQTPLGAFPSELINRSNGKLKRGSAYALLARMEDAKLVSSESVQPTELLALARTKYKITAAGQNARIELANYCNLPISYDFNFGV